MDWIIQSKDESSGRTGDNHYTTEAGFLAALRDLFSNPRKQFINATLPDGTILDEAAARKLVGFAIGESGIGEDPIG
jgi:hypothetical protein